MTGPWKRCEVIGDATLYLGDCLEVLPTLGAVDHILSDPPYGDDATHAGHLSSIKLRDGTPAGQALGFDGISADTLCVMAEAWTKQARRWVVFTCEWKHAHLLDEAGLLVRLGIWRKPDGAPQFTGDRPGMGWEAVAICHRKGRKRWNGGGRHAFWSVCKGGKWGHPTEKPIGLVGAWVRDFTDEGETVLDPFMGSGSIGEACISQQRRFVGIERDVRWFDIACRRIEAETRAPRFDLPQPVKPTQGEML